MALPCVCYKCARYIELITLKDQFCLSVEEENCKNRICDDCDFVCNRFTDSIEGVKKEGISTFFNS